MRKNSKLFFLTARTNWVLADDLYTGWYDEFSNAVTEYRTKQEKEEGRSQEYLYNLKHVKDDPGSIGQYPLSWDRDSGTSLSSTSKEAESHTIPTKHFSYSRTTVKKAYPLRNHRNKVPNHHQSRHVSRSLNEKAKKCDLTYGSVTLPDVPLSDCCPRLNLTKQALTQEHDKKKNIVDKNQTVKEYPLRKRKPRPSTSPHSTTAEGKTTSRVTIVSRYEKSVSDRKHDLLNSSVVNTRLKHRFDGRIRKSKTEDRIRASILKAGSLEKSITLCLPTSENPLNVIQDSSQSDHVDNHHYSQSSEVTGQTNEIDTFKCSICTKSYRSNSRLKMHMNLHTGRCFSCDVCGIKFTAKRHLKRHMVMHSGLKEHVCDKCNMAFVRKDNLKRHMLTHTSLRPFRCKMCSATFKRKGHLHSHMLSHGGVKPYKCKLCEKQYCRRLDLNLHIRLFHQGWQRPRPYKCCFKNCRKAFTTMSHLKRHMKNLHESCK